MSNDLLKFGAQEGSSWYYHYEQDCLAPGGEAAEKEWFPKPRPSAYDIELRKAKMELNAIIRASRPKKEPKDTWAAQWLKGEAE